MIYKVEIEKARIIKKDEKNIETSVIGDAYEKIGMSVLNDI